MKKFNLSLVAVLAMSTFAVAGGDIAPVEEPVVVVPEVIEESAGGLYLGLGYSALKSDSNFFDFTGSIHHPTDATISFDDDYSAIMLQAGYKFNDYVAVEGRYWAGLTDNSFTITGNTFDSNANAWGVYVKPMYPVTDALDIYALLGYADVTVSDVQIGSRVRDFAIDGFSWGVGAAYSFTDSLAVFVDYVDFQDDDIRFTHTSDTTDISGTFEHAFDSINLGVTYTF